LRLQARQTQSLGGKHLKTAFEVIASCSPLALHVSSLDNGKSMRNVTDRANAFFQCKSANVGQCQQATPLNVGEEKSL